MLRKTQNIYEKRVGPIVMLFWSKHTVVIATCDHVRTLVRCNMKPELARIVCGTNLQLLCLTTSDFMAFSGKTNSCSARGIASGSRLTFSNLSFKWTNDGNLRMLNIKLHGVTIQPKIIALLSKM